MDKLKQYIEEAQNKTSQEKHSIALVVAGAVSGGLFALWLAVGLYSLNTATAPAAQTQPTTSTDVQDVLQQQIESVEQTSDAGTSGQLSEPTYVDLDSVPAVYRPDSVGQPVQTNTENTQTTTPPQDTTVQGSDASTSVVE